MEFIEQNEFPVNYQTIVHKSFSLYWACQYDRPLVVRELLTKGADPNLVNSIGETAMGAAQSEEVRQMLVEAGAKDKKCLLM
jgi:ankyrin repeat protein